MGPCDVESVDLENRRRRRGIEHWYRKPVRDIVQRIVDERLRGGRVHGSTVDRSNEENECHFVAPFAYKPGGVVINVSRRHREFVLVSS